MTQLSRESGTIHLSPLKPKAVLVEDPIRRSVSPDRRPMRWDSGSEERELPHSAGPQTSFLRPHRLAAHLAPTRDCERPRVFAPHADASRALLPCLRIARLYEPNHNIVLPDSRLRHAIANV